MDDKREHPTVNHPLHGEKRPLLTPTLAVIGLVVAVVVIFGVITLLRYNT